MKVVISGGFLLVSGLLHMSRVRTGERIMAAWRRAIELSLGDEGYSEVEIDSAIANGTGEPGRAGADIAGLSGRPVVFCGRSGARTASSDRAALRRARRCGRPDGCARRSPSWRAARRRTSAIPTNCGRPD